MSKICGWVATAADQPLVLTSIDAGELGDEEVEVTVEYCGICHSDLSMIRNGWHNASYAFIPGHEVIGRVSALGAHTTGLQLGQPIGIGWTAEGCMHCQ